MSRQLDIPQSGYHYGTLPRDVPGVLQKDDFIRFHWPRSLDPQRYKVIVEALHGEPTYRSIGGLSSEKHLPHVQFGPYAKIGVVPDVQSLPSFEGHLVRGGTYVIPDTRGMNGRFGMESHGNIL